MHADVGKLTGKTEVGGDEGCGKMRKEICKRLLRETTPLATVDATLLFFGKEDMESYM